MDYEAPRLELMGEVVEITLVDGSLKEDAN